MRLSRRERDKQIKFYVNERELNQINKRAKAANMPNRGAYLRKMAIDGFVVNIDTKDLKRAVKEMNLIGRNINQIVRNANINGVAKSDIDAIRSKVDDIWQLLRYTLLKVQSARR